MEGYLGTICRSFTHTAHVGRHGSVPLGVGQSGSGEGMPFLQLDGMALPAPFSAGPSIFTFCSSDRSSSAAIFERIQRLWGSSTIDPFVSVTVHGQEYIDVVKGQGAVFISNHQSWLDAYALFKIPDLPLKVLLKKSLTLIPVVGWVMALIGHIPLDRGSKEARRQAVEQCASVLQSGVPIFIFPEGTRSKEEGKMRPFKAGAFKLAKEANVPIVPMTIRNTGRLMPTGSELSLKEGHVDIYVHPPLWPKQDEDLDALRARARAAIQSGLEH